MFLKECYKINIFYSNPANLKSPVAFRPYFTISLAFIYNTYINYNKNLKKIKN